MPRYSTPFHNWFPTLKGSLIVSCQALEDEALFGAEYMARMALAAQMGGATAIRANTPPDIRAIRQLVNLPIFGLFKAWIPDCDVYLTPTLSHALQIAEAGADVICIDATNRIRPGGLKLSDLIEKYHWLSAPEVHDDLIALEQASQEYHIMATLVARKHRRNEVQYFSCSEKVNAQQRLAILKAEPEAVSLLPGGLPANLRIPSGPQPPGKGGAQLNLDGSQVPLQ